MMSAILIISEIGVDMTQFETDKQLCRLAGLSPANNESAGKKKLPVLIKQDSILSQYQYNVHLHLLKTKTAILVKSIQESKKEEDTKSNYCDCKNDASQYSSHDSYWRNIQSIRL